MPSQRRSPVFIGPHQAERHLDIAGFQKLFERPLEQALPVEPIVVIHKAMDAGRLREFRLPPYRLDIGKRIKAQSLGDISADSDP